MNRYPNYRPHFAARGQQHRPPFRERFHGGHDDTRGRHMNPISVPFPENNTHIRGPRPRFPHAYDIGNAQSNMGPRGYQPNAQIRHHSAYPRLPMGNTTAGVGHQNHIHMTEDSENGISRDGNPHHSKPSPNLSTNGYAQGPLHVDHIKKDSSSFNPLPVNSENDAAVLCGKDTWVHTWIQKKICDANADSAKNPYSMVDLRPLIKRAAILTRQLKEIRDLLSNTSVEESVIKAKLQEANILKSQLLEVQGEFGSQENLQEALARKTTKARKRRARLKRKRNREYMEALEREEERQKRHREIDAWQEKIYEKIQDMKMENELKEIADKTLEEVRRKVSESKRALEALAVTAKLRAARKEAFQQQGLYVSKMSDTLFEQRHEEMVTLMTKQLQTYEKEQRLLQVILESEKADMEQHEAEERQRSKDEKEERLEGKIRLRLFGPQDDYPPHHPLYPYFQFYNRANVYPQEFIQIRRGWDAYLVPEDNPLGTYIPQGWVRPTEPSSVAWSSALKTKAEPP